MSANNRASLLAGLRTGGVRQPGQMMPQTAAPNVSSFGHLDMPMTAAVNGSFNPILPAQQAQRAQQQQQQAFQMQMVQMEILRLQVSADSIPLFVHKWLGPSRAHPDFFGLPSAHHSCSHFSLFLAGIAAGPAAVSD